MHCSHLASFQLKMANIENNSFYWPIHRYISSFNEDFSHMKWQFELGNIQAIIF